MRKTRSLLACLVLAGGGLVSGVATAAPASAAVCSWRVVETAQVRENPSLDSVVRKTKYPGEIVTGGRQFCFPVKDNDGREWDEVHCTCATDGLGYIVSSKLYQLTEV